MDEHKQAPDLGEVELSQSPSELLEEIAAKSKWDDRIADYVSKGAPDAEIMRQMVDLRGKELDLKIREREELARVEFFRDLLVAQKAAPTIVWRDSDKPGGEGKGGGQGSAGKVQAKYTWASLAKAVKEVVPVFNAHRFTVTHEHAMREDGKPCLATVLEHELGHQRRVLFPLEPDTSGGKSKPQSHGSAYTYARRNGIAAVCGFATADMPDADRIEENIGGVNLERNEMMVGTLEEKGIVYQRQEDHIGKKATEWTGADLEDLWAWAKAGAKPGLKRLTPEAIERARLYSESCAEPDVPEPPVEDEGDF